VVVGRHPSTHSIAAMGVHLDGLEGTGRASPLKAWKTMKKLNKKLRDMDYIEARCAAGLKVDPMQILKLERKSEVVAQLEEAQRRLAAEEARHAEEQQPDRGATDACPLRREGLPEKAAEQHAPETCSGLLACAESPLQKDSVECPPNAWPVVLVPVMFCWVPDHYEQELDASPFKIAPVHVPDYLWQEPDASSEKVAPVTVLAPDHLTRKLPWHPCRQRAMPRTRGPQWLGGAAQVPWGHGADCCEKWIEDLRLGGDARAGVVAALRGSVWYYSQKPNGCRVVQEALGAVQREVALELVEELHGHTREAIESPYANFVLQQVVKVMPVASNAFIVGELRGFGCEMARHRYGCRVLCRLLEHGGSSTALAELIDEVLQEAAWLCSHTFAYHVLARVLEYSSPKQRSQVCAVLRADLFIHAKHRCTSHLVEGALLYCSPEEQHALVDSLLSLGPETLVLLAQNQFGSFVVRALLRRQDACACVAGYLCEANAALRLQFTNPGKRVLGELPEAKRQVLPEQQEFGV